MAQYWGMTTADHQQDAMTETITAEFCAESGDLFLAGDDRSIASEIYSDDEDWDLVDTTTAMNTAPVRPA